MAAAASDLAPNGDSAVVSRIPAPIHYVCGRFLSLKKPVVIPSLMATITTIWGLKEKISIQEEEAGVYVFLFKDKEEKNRVLRDGPWFYGGSMLVLADYDGLRPLEAVELNHLEIWVAVKGLRIGMRDDLTLSRFGRELGEFIDVDPVAVRRRDLIQRICIWHDVRRRILSCRWFDFSPEFPVLLETRYEKCHGICADCGFFGHGGGACDNGLVVAAGTSARGTAEAGSGKTPAAEVTAELDASRLQFSSAGKSHGLTAGSSGQQRTLVNGPAEAETDGLHLLDVGYGPLGSTGLMSKSFDDSSDLDEPLLKLKKRGRSYGSKNKGPSKKKRKKKGSSLVTFPVAKAAEIVCPDDKGKCAT